MNNVPDDPERKQHSRGDLRRELESMRTQFDAAKEQLDAANERLERKVGRNLPAAIGIAVLLAGCVIGAMLWSSLAVVVLVSVVVGVCIFELATALRLGRYQLGRWPLAIIGVAITFSAYFGGIGVSLLLVLAGALVHLVILLLLRRKPVVSNTIAGAFVLGYIAWLFSFVSALVALPSGRLWVAVIISLVVINDTMAYVSGLNFGKHPMVPRISPKKTWEGLIGAAASVIIAAVIGFVWILHIQWWVGVVVGICVVFTATLGDLVESVIKRELGTKDMSSWLPGHGGFLDRVDAILLTMPLALITYLIIH